MGQVLHRSATTTEAIRRAIQHSQESLRLLARRHGINPKTVAKWRRRDCTADRRTGPSVPKSTVLSVEQEAIIVAFRKHTLLPLDDCLYALQATIPQLTRSSLHRCLERHGISRLPEVEGDKPRRKKFDSYPIGFFHIDLTEVRTAEGKLYLFVAIDRTSKFAVVELVEKADVRAATAFLEALVEAVPYRIHTVLTDNGIQFADLPKNRQGPTARFRGHPFDRACHVHGIEHRLTKPNHPWTNGQVERMNELPCIAGGFADSDLSATAFVILRAPVIDDDTECIPVCFGEGVVIGMPSLQSLEIFEGEDLADEHTVFVPADIVTRVDPSGLKASWVVSSHARQGAPISLWLYLIGQ